MRSREREAWIKVVEEAHEERVMLLEQLQKMADRVQRPEVLPSPRPAIYEHSDPPKADYSWVGEQVPDFVDVGTKEVADAEH